MNEFIKQFFGPTWKSAIIKIVIGFLLFVVFTIIYENTKQYVADYNAGGWPLIYSSTGGLGENGTVSHSYNPFALIFDIVFWYVLLCLIVFVYNKVKK